MGGRGELGGPVQEGEVGGELLRVHGGCGSVLGLTVTTCVHCTLMSECTLENWFLNQGVSVKGSEMIMMALVHNVKMPRGYNVECIP